MLFCSVFDIRFFKLKVVGYSIFKFKFKIHKYLLMWIRKGPSPVITGRVAKITSFGSKTLENHQNKACYFFLLSEIFQISTL